MQSSQYRQLAFDEHGRECMRCGSGNDLEVHHKDRDRDNNSPENLEVLCHGCHMEEHHDERVERMQLHEGPADEKMLVLLKRGRVTAPYAAEETGYSNAYARDILNDLVDHGHARKIHTGLYEFVSDPREDDNAE